MVTMNNGCDQNADLRLLRPSLPCINWFCLDGRHRRRSRQLQRLLHRCRSAGARAAWWQGSSSLKPLLRIVAGAARDLPQLQADEEEVSLQADGRIWCNSAQAWNGARTSRLPTLQLSSTAHLAAE